MASAMRKMAVYLGLVEGDHRYDDQYQDEYAAEEYEEYGAEFIDAGDPRDLNGHAETALEPTSRVPEPRPPPRRPCRYRPRISRVSPHCTRVRTMRLVRSGSTSARALR